VQFHGSPQQLIEPPPRSSRMAGMRVESPAALLWIIAIGAGLISALFLGAAAWVTLGPGHTLEGNEYSLRALVAAAVAVPAVFQIWRLRRSAAIGRMSFTLVNMLVVITFLAAAMSWWQAQTRWADERYAYLHEVGALGRGSPLEAPFPLNYLGVESHQSILVPRDASRSDLARGRALFPESHVCREEWLTIAEGRKIPSPEGADYWRQKRGWLWQPPDTR
jgi:hypothetical protein